MAERVLLTGAAGFLGAWCAELLLAGGHEVIALVRDRDPRSRFYTLGLDRRCIEVRAELADAERLLAEYQPTRVLHLAAQTQVPTANHSPLSSYESNLRGTWLLLEACRSAASPPSGVLVASSDKAYGAAPLPYREDGPLLPIGPYDVSKACADLVARNYGSHFDLPVVVSRCANLYGPGDLNELRLVPGVSLALVRGERPSLRSSGRMTREWLYVQDAAEATLLLLERAAELRGRAVNIGSGEVHAVRDIVARLMHKAKSHLTASFQPHDPNGEIRNQSVDGSTLASLGWSARVGIDEGLSLSLDWYRSTVASGASSRR